MSSVVTVGWKSTTTLVKTHYAGWPLGKNHLFFGSDRGGENVVIIYSLLITCRLNGVEPESWLREVSIRINNHPSNRVYELLPRNLSHVK